MGNSNEREREIEREIGGGRISKQGRKEAKEGRND